MLEENNYLAWFGWLVFCLVAGMLAQTYLLPYWLGMGAALIGWKFWQQRLDNSYLIKPQIFWLFSLMFLGLLGNILVSQSWQVTVAEAMGWIFMILVGWSALVRPPKAEAQILIWLGGLVLIFVTGMVSLSTWFFPTLRLLPDMNYLYATFGHNHWSIWLLISLPWVVLADKVWPSKIWKILVGVWIIWLASTFGRWAMGVMLLEIIWLWRWLNDDLSWRKWLKSYLLISSILIVGLLTWSNWLSVPANCPKLFQQFPQLCKPIQSEQRPEYWRQAIEGLNSQPFLGHGFGTFNQISLLERKTLSSYSGYVHNDYLQWIVEAGWLGWLITIIFWLIWWKNRPREIFSTLSSSSQSEDLFQRVVWLSAGGILINSLIDFDLHFVMVRLLLIVYLSWLTAWKIGRIYQPKISLFQTRIQTGTLIFLIGLCLFWAGYFGLTNYWWQHDQKKLVWQQPYYFPAHSLWLMSGYEQASPAQQARVFDDWLGQTDSLEVLLVKYPDKISPAQKIIAMEQLYKLNPWSRVNMDLVTVYLESGDWLMAQDTLLVSDEFFNQQASLGVQLNLVNDEMRWKMARYAVKLAELAIAHNELELGLKNLKLAQKYEVWALGEEQAKYGDELRSWVAAHPHPTRFEKHNLDQIFNLTILVDSSRLGFNQTALVQAALLRLHDLLSQRACQENECLKLVNYAKSITQTADWVEENLIRFRLEFPQEKQLQSE